MWGEGGQVHVYLARSCGYLSITSTVDTSPTQNPTALNPLEPQPLTLAPTRKCISLKQSPHYISPRLLLLLHKISGRLWLCGWGEAGTGGGSGWRAVLVL